MNKVKGTMNVCVEIFQYSRSILASSRQDIAEVINPMKMFEYMAVGRTIVCADISVIREVLNEKNVVFVESSGGRVVLSEAERSRRTYRDHDVGELENSRISDWRLAIESLLADESRRLALGAQARMDVERFSWVRREEGILKSLVQESA